MLRVTQRKFWLAGNGPIQRLVGSVGEHVGGELQQSLRDRNCFPFSVPAPLGIHAASARERGREGWREGGVKEHLQSNRTSGVTWARCRDMGMIANDGNRIG